MADSIEFDAYLPIYDTVPEDWEQARQFLVQQLKKISEIVNAREIGYHLEQELLAGQDFIPSAGSGQEFRAVFRKVVNTGALVIGANAIPHGITFDANFTLVHLYGAATNSALPRAIPLPNDIVSVVMDGVNIIITSDMAYNRSFVTVEYLKEL